jgi:hypothetical protein
LGICDPQSIHISDSKIRVQVNAILFYDNEEYFVYQMVTTRIFTMR